MTMLSETVDVVIGTPRFAVRPTPSDGATRDRQHRPVRSPIRTEHPFRHERPTWNDSTAASRAPQSSRVLLMKSSLQPKVGDGLLMHGAPAERTEWLRLDHALRHRVFMTDQLTEMHLTTQTPIPPLHVRTRQR